MRNTSRGRAGQPAPDDWRASGARTPARHSAPPPPARLACATGRRCRSPLRRAGGRGAPRGRRPLRSRVASCCPLAPSCECGAALPSVLASLSALGRAVLWTQASRRAGRAPLARQAQPRAQVPGLGSTQRQSLGGLRGRHSWSTRGRTSSSPPPRASRRRNSVASGTSRPVGPATTQSSLPQQQSGRQPAPRISRLGTRPSKALRLLPGQWQSPSGASRAFSLQLKARAAAALSFTAVALNLFQARASSTARVPISIAAL